MSLNEDRDKSKDKITRMALRSARYAHAAAQERLTDATKDLTEALRAYTDHFGTEEGS